MRGYPTRLRVLAVGLATLSGFVDALGFLELRGMFVSFMSGNSTRMAVGVTSPELGSFFAGALIAAFIAGVMLGTAWGAMAGRWRKQAVMACISLVLTTAYLVQILITHSAVATVLMAGAMGAANTVFQRDGEVSVGVTYMTGTLVKIGQHLTTALAGGPRFAWAPYLFLWLGLVGGAMAGALAFATLGLGALIIAVAWSALLLVVAVATGPLNR